MSSYIQFGSGRLYLNPNAGNLATNPTPLQGMTIQDVQIDMTGDVKELKGSSQFPDDVAAGDKKGTGKFAIGRKDLELFNQIFFADTIATGGTSVAPNESHSIPATTPYTVVVTPPNSGTFSVDLGVNYAASGIALVKVGTSPATGQYSVAEGTYTFAAGDQGVGVIISYAYTITGSGATYQVNNQALGYGPQVEMWLVDTYQPKNVGSAGAPVYEYNVIRIYAAKVTKLTIGNKRADYSIPEIDFSYFQSPSGRVIDMFSVNG